MYHIVFEHSVCSKCTSRNCEHVTQGDESFTRCRHCGHEGDRVKNNPFITTGGGVERDFVVTQSERHKQF